MLCFLVRQKVNYKLDDLIFSLLPMICDRCQLFASKIIKKY